MRRALRLLGIVALLAVVMLLLLLPPRSIETAAPPASTVRGAYHIHTNRSDGSGTPDDVAEAAARAGLQFIILTDHGDGTRTPDPPVYRSGVLTIDGVELNTTGGHYAALGMPAAPYPIAGTPGGRDRRRDTARRFRHRRTSGLAAAVAAVDGLGRGVRRSRVDQRGQRMARRASRCRLRAHWRRICSARRSRWPRCSIGRPPCWRNGIASVSARRVLAIAGTDAHARLGFSQRTDPDGSAIHVPLPGYTATFRAFSNHVVLDAPLSGDAAGDAGRLLAALRNGRLYSVIDALASPGSLSFSAASGSRPRADRRRSRDCTVTCNCARR